MMMPVATKAAPVTTEAMMVATIGRSLLCAYIGVLAHVMSAMCCDAGTGSGMLSSGSPENSIIVVGVITVLFSVFS